MHFPELLPWVVWCYGSYSILWHPMGQISSQSGVQKGDPLGPLLFSLVLRKIVSTVDSDDECLNLLFQAWFLDDGVIASRRSDVQCALSLIDELRSPLGIYINLAKM